MRSELAQRVYPVIQYALALRDRLCRGERPSLRLEQAAFLGLLGVGADEHVPVDYGGDMAGGTGAGPSVRDHDDTVFLGARYAVVCWLDELFVHATPWSEQWNEHKLEVSLYASNERAWRFWSQARLAASRGMTDVLEVFYLCALLGFRGEMRDQPDKYREWCEAAAQQIRRSHERRWESPPDLALPRRIAVRVGRRRLRNALLAASLVVSLLIPGVVAFLLRAAG